MVEEAVADWEQGLSLYMFEWTAAAQVPAAQQSGNPQQSSPSRMARGESIRIDCNGLNCNQHYREVVARTDDAHVPAFPQQSGILARLGTAR